MPLERLFTGQSLLWTRPRAGVSLRRFSLWYLKQLVSPRKTRTLIKDPLAFLSAESLARRFDTKVIVHHSKTGIRRRKASSDGVGISMISNDTWG